MFKKLIESLLHISDGKEYAFDADTGRWITVHPNGAGEGKGRKIHLDETGLIDSNGPLADALKAKEKKSDSGIRRSIVGAGSVEAGGESNRDTRTTRLAPNGKRSNLTDRQYDMVRTPEFKAWFGDWENDPENASKVVDENGEPLVVYHGTSKFGFTIFDLSKTYDGISIFTTSSIGVANTYSYGNGKVRRIGEKIDRTAYKKYKMELQDVIRTIGERLSNAEYDMSMNRLNEAYEIYEKFREDWIYDADGASRLKYELVKLIDKNESAEDDLKEELFEYADKAKSSAIAFADAIVDADIDESSGNYALFVNAKNPYIVNGKGSNWDMISDENISQDDLTTRDVASYAKEHGHDGVIFRAITDNGWGGHENAEDVFVAFSPTQIKSATDNTGAFSPSNPDIRYSIPNSRVANTSNTTRAMVDVLKVWIPGIKAEIKEVNQKSISSNENNSPTASTGSLGHNISQSPNESQEGKKGNSQSRQAMKAPNGKVAGWYDRNTGEVKLVNGVATPATVAHEIGWHATFHWAEKNHPELHKKLIQYAKEAPEGIEKSVKEKYGTNLTPNELLDEIGAERFTREDISPLLDKAQKTASEQFFDRVEDEQDNVRRAFVKANSALSRKELDEIAKLPPKEAVATLVQKMLEGRSLGGKPAGKGKGADNDGADDPPMFQLLKAIKRISIGTK